jgi:peroxiredoxin
MRSFVAALFAFGLTLQAAAPVPRQAPDLIIKEANGKTTRLASQEGKVCIIQFLDTTCPHCQNAAVMLSKLQGELGPQGLQVFGVAFNDLVNTPNPSQNSAATGEFAMRFAKFPVGMASRETALKFLGLSVMERFYVPQILIVDKKGVIRYQDKPQPTGELSTEASLRKLVTGLLAEGAAPAKAKSTGGIKQVK